MNKETDFMDSSSMQGRNYFVTGAGSGIGRATAKLLLERGANVFCFSKNVAKLESLEKETSGTRSSLSSNIIVFSGDVSQEDDIEKSLQVCSQKLGPLSGAFNCAGVLGRLRRIEELTVEDFDEVVSINLRGLFLCLKHQIRQAKAHSPDIGLSIVNCSSAAGESGFPLGSIYAASKAGVISLTQTAARECSGSAIRVNALLPGGTLTEMTDSVLLQFPNWVQEGSAKTPLGRFADPLELARVACFLLSEESSYMTGACVRVDGGVNC